MDLYETARPGANGYREASPADLRQSQPLPRIIDVREPEEFSGELGHLAGAELVPLATLATAALPWDRGAPLLLVCRSGKRSAQAAEALCKLGFARVVNLEGGMLAYAQAQLAGAAP